MHRVLRKLTYGAVTMAAAAGFTVAAAPSAQADWYSCYRYLFERGQGSQAQINVCKRTERDEGKIGNTVSCIIDLRRLGVTTEGYAEEACRLAQL